MFWRSKDKDKTEARLRLLENLLINGNYPYDERADDYVHIPGLATKFNSLINEHEKLKAVVAELVDYVYGDQ